MKRGRNQRRRQGANPNRALDSNGPDVRIRGTANQIYDKYTALARDASSSGDRVKAENYLQHAEHYFRVIRSVQQSQQQQQPQQQPQPQSDGDGDQPAVEDGDEQPRKNTRRGNGRDRRPVENKAAENKAAEDKATGAGNGEETASDDAKAKDAGDASADEAPKKPRRRRVKRAAAEDADAGNDKEEAPAAAE